MALETGTYIDDLVATNPTGADNVNQGDDHIRLIKSVLQNTFTNADAAFDLSQVPTYVAKAACNTATEVEFESLPSWANRITMYFDGVSANGTANWLMQIRDATGWVSTGYSSLTFRHNAVGAVAEVSSTSGFMVNISAGADVLEGKVVFERTEASGNEWVCTLELYRSDDDFVFTAYGRIAHSAALTGVRLNFNGDTGDAGEVSLRYER